VTARKSPEQNMEDNGALSNPRATVELARLADLTRALRRRAAGNARRPRPVPAKATPVLETVTCVLERAKEPMPVAEIHRAANELLGRPLRRSSVKGTLAAHAVGRDRRFTRTGRGVYELGG
jgi:hypothetical protein